ncbi:SpoIIAA family protein [Geodermatophilus marinus]|uniref:STAS/SEC14 domain-containing protein n=1 Tax=Geodermatophilus sp. LHW52908 TaxID=2303986 RepID=UPI0013141F60|nr:STAS/SEC14 domain-containing protein [Geodermatophilus sp. LHW52908]
MPPGTLGFTAGGEVDDDDFDEVVAPVLRREVAEGRKIRLLYVLGPEVREHEGDATGAELGFAARHPTAWERVAVVSDEEWLRPAMRVLSVLLPGRMRAFPVRELDRAKAWVAADEETAGEQATAGAAPAG